MFYTVINQTHRGLKKVVISLTTKRAKTVALTEQSENNQSKISIIYLFKKGKQK